MKEELAHRLVVAMNSAEVYGKFVHDMLDGMTERFGDMPEVQRLRDAFSGATFASRIARVWADEATEEQLIEFVGLAECSSYQRLLAFASTIEPRVRAVAGSYWSELTEEIEGAPV